MTMLALFNCQYKYHLWANERILRTAANLTQEQFTAKVFPHHDSVRGTLVHTLGAEWIWLERWHGTSPAAILREDDAATLETVRERWSQEDRRLGGFLAGLRDEDLLRVVSYTNIKGKPLAYPLWQLMAHVFNHSTQHRSEAAAMLTEMGYSPGDLDLVYFLPEWSG